MDLKELLANEEIAKHIASLGSIDDVHAFLKDKGIDIDKEKLVKKFADIFGVQTGELDESSLEEVAGGGVRFKFEKPDWWPPKWWPW